MGNNEGRHTTILLVEDDVLIAMAEKMNLEKYGYHVLSVHSGEDAVNTVTQTPDIHLVLMDIDLGAGIDGTEAARQLLHIKDLPIVFLSSHMEPDIVEKTEKITSYGYVVKNSSMTVLDASIKMAFKLFAAKQELLAHDIKQQAMISNISDVIAILDTNCIIRYKSPNVEKWFGWHAEDLVGMNCWQTVHPDDRERIQHVFMTLLDTEHSTATVEYRYHCKDGRYTPIQLTATNLVNNPVIGGVLLNYHDITERKRAEDALRASEEKFRIAFRTSPDAVNMNRLSDGVYLDINDGFTKIMGYTPDDVIGKSSLSLNIWKYEADRHALVNALQAHGYVENLEAEFVAKDGSMKNGLMSARMIEIDGEHVILSVTRDITERKTIERELAAHRDHLQTLVAEYTKTLQAAGE